MAARKSDSISARSERGLVAPDPLYAGVNWVPEGLFRRIAEYTDSFLWIASEIGLKEASLVWLDEAVEVLAHDVRGDVTSKGPRSVKQQCFVTLPDGTIRHLPEWVTGPSREDVEEGIRRGEVPTMPIPSFVDFNIRLTALRRLLREKTVVVPDGARTQEEKVIEAGPVLRCVAAYKRAQLRRGRRAKVERPLPDKAKAFRDLAAHLGLASNRSDPQDLRRRVQRARARLR